MKYLVLVSVMFILFACKKQTLETPYDPVNGICVDTKCDVTFGIDTSVWKEVKVDTRGYWHVKYVGFNYTTIIGKLSKLNSKYVINGVPLIESQFDSDYWVLLDSISWKIPQYNRFGLYTDRNFTNPIPFKDTIITLQGLTKIGRLPINIVGYQLTSTLNLNSPTAEAQLKTYSKYTYTPKMNILFSRFMRGDTANVYINTIFNNDVGSSIKKEYNLKIIFE